MNKKVFKYAVVSYVVALFTSPMLPELITLIIPIAAMAAAYRQEGKQNGTNIPAVIPAAETPPAPPVQAAPPAPPAAPPALPVQQKPKAEPVDPEFGPVLEYLEVLEDMIISEGQKNNLDDEIVDKSLALFARLQRVIPLLRELNNGNINHMIRRLVLKDLNGFITPFLRLSGETKTKNRRTLLNGLKEINTKISTIVETIEHKDLIELQTKADLIHSRYSESDY